MKKNTAISFLLSVAMYAGAQAPCYISVNPGTPNCAAGSTNNIPINDLGSGTFTNAWSVTWTGGLYPGGSNTIPAAHKSAGLTQASQIQPLDNAGNPATGGSIVLLSIGISNTNAEYCEFDSLAALDPCKSSKVVIVNGAQGSMPVQYISTSSYPQYNTFWNTVDTRLTNASVTANQVQAVWFKDLNPAGTTPIQEYYDSLVAQFKRVMVELVTRYPNIKVCFFSSRISARYTDVNAGLNPEPYAYYQGWACKEVIAQQISGNLPYSGAGRVAPWIAWGPYLWSDGNTPQATNPNISWTCPADFALDGTHPSFNGARKVGDLLLCFFKNDSTSYTWFTANGSPCPSSCSLTAVNEVSMKEIINVYPNPFTNSTTISIEQNVFIHEKQVSLYIYDLIGNEIGTIENISTNEFMLRKNDLPTGICFYKIISKTNGYKEIGRGKLILH